MGSKAVNALLAKGAEQQQKLNKRINQVPFLKTKDKFSFVLGISLMVIIEYIVLEAPRFLPLLYTALVFPLLLYRFFDYHKSNYHYFMLDFCYYMQVFTLFLVWAFPNDIHFFKLFFGLSNGPLLFAIIIWKNRVVFHDLDKLTSLFIHILPPLVSFVFRWLLPADQSMFANPTAKHSLSRADFFYMMFFYALWQFLYWVKVEVVDHAKLSADTSIITAAKWLSEYQPHPLYIIINKRYPFIKPQSVLIGTQLVYTALTLCLIPLMYNYYWFHSFILILNFGFACWYGAQFYFESFAENYAKRLEKTVEKFNNPEKVKDNDFQRKYCPNSVRSVIIFQVYFGLALGVLLVAWRFTIWS